MSESIAKNGFLLTVAIPTYNRADILDISLSKLLPQISDFKNDIEIILSDNASEDHTQQIINKYKEKYSEITIRSNLQPYNTGYYGNFRKCRELSSGKYFWLLSDNEHLVDNVIGFLIEKIKSIEDVGVFYFENAAKPESNQSLFSISESNLDSLIVNESAYELTLISSVVILNDKTNDPAILSDYFNNSFIGFLFLCNALIKQGKIICIAGKAMESARCNVYFDIFKSWTEDMMACVKYMTEKNLLTRISETQFITGYLKHVMYLHVYLYRLHGKLHGKTYGTAKEVKSLLDSYYSDNNYYNKHIVRLFNYPRFFIIIGFILKKVFRKFRKMLFYHPVV